jgi:hypothetical protein
MQTCKHANMYNVHVAYNKIVVWDIRGWIMTLYMVWPYVPQGTKHAKFEPICLFYNDNHTTSEVMGQC